VQRVLRRLLLRRAWAHRPHRVVCCGLLLCPQRPDSHPSPDHRCESLPHGVVLSHWHGRPCGLSCRHPQQPHGPSGRRRVQPVFGGPVLRQRWPLSGQWGVPGGLLLQRIFHSGEPCCRLVSCRCILWSCICHPCPVSHRDVFQRHRAQRVHQLPAVQCRKLL
jgi:hypothetical protein